MQTTPAPVIIRASSFSKMSSLGVDMKLRAKLLLSAVAIFYPFSFAYVTDGDL